VLDRAEQIAQHWLAHASRWPVFALDDRLLTLTFDTQVDAMVAAKWCAQHNISKFTVRRPTPRRLLD
jgi:hypothetical protein